MFNRCVTCLQNTETALGTVKISDYLDLHISCKFQETASIIIFLRNKLKQMDSWQTQQHGLQKKKKCIKMSVHVMYYNMHTDNTP